MSAVTMTTTLTNGHAHLNGKLETSLNGYRKNGYAKPESIETPVSTVPLLNIAFLCTKYWRSVSSLHKSCDVPDRLLQIGLSDMLMTVNSASKNDSKQTRFRRINTSCREDQSETSRISQSLFNCIQTIDDLTFICLSYSRRIRKHLPMYFTCSNSILSTSEWKWLAT